LILPTFYEQLFGRFPLGKKLQTQTVGVNFINVICGRFLYKSVLLVPEFCAKSLRAALLFLAPKFCTKNARVKR